MSNTISHAEAAQIGAKTLWIGDVEPWMDEAYVASLFTGVAQVLSVKLIKDKLKGYGFVEFQTHEVAKQVLNNLNTAPIPGTTRNFKLNWATHGNGGLKTPTSSIVAFNPQALQNQSQNGPQGEFQLYVGDLDPNVNDTILLAAFNKRYPSVIQAKIIVDPVSRVSKGYGFVKFGRQDDFQRAMQEMQGKYLLTKPMKINYASQKKNSHHGGGGGGGHHGGHHGGGHHGGQQQQQQMMFQGGDRQQMQVPPPPEFFQQNPGYMPYFGGYPMMPPPMGQQQQGPYGMMPPMPPPPQQRVWGQEQGIPMMNDEMARAMEMGMIPPQQMFSYMPPPPGMFPPPSHLQPFYPPPQGQFPPMHPGVRPPMPPQQKLNLDEKAQKSIQPELKNGKSESMFSKEEINEMNKEYLKEWSENPDVVQIF